MTMRASYNEIDIGKLKQLLLCDPVMGTLTWLPRPREVFTSQRNWRVWNANFANKPALTSLSAGYKTGRILGRPYRAHRVIFAMTAGYWPPNVIDHINGDTADNRFCNLRAVSQQVNMMNRTVSVANKSGVAGVDWHKKSQRWRARICVAGQTLCLGHYLTREAAASAWKAASEEHGIVLKPRRAAA